MFYSAQILAKKGPLGTIWIAAHLDKRLKRHQVFETSITASVDTIINAEVPLALRLSGQLLLGVVRVYSRKVGYLFQDCNDALVKLKQAFKPGDVDLPADHDTAPINAITLPDNYNGIDLYGASVGFTFDALEGAEPIGRVQFSLGPRDSFVLADDLSDMFGTQMSMDEERFEAAGDELERHLSIDDPEKLRSAAVEAPQPDHFYDMGAELSGGHMQTPDGGMDDEMMMAPPDDMLQLDPAGPSPARPQSHTTRSGGLTPGLTPASNAADALPSLGGLPTPGNSIRAGTPQLEVADAAFEEAEPAPRPAAQRLGPRRKRLRLDVDADNRPQCELASKDIRSLLQDRKPLMTRRGKAGASRLTQGPVNPLSVALQAEQAGDSALYHPAICDIMAPALYRLYQRALNSKQAAAATGRDPPASPAKSARSHRQAGASASARIEGDADRAEQSNAAATNTDGPEAAGMMLQDQFDGDDGMFGAEEQYMDTGHDHDVAETDLGSPGGATHGEDGDAHLAPPSPTLSGARRRSSTGGEAHGGGGQAVELGAEPDVEDTSKSSFTQRTKLVQAHLQAQFYGDAGRKRKARAGEPRVPSVPSVGLDSLVAGKTRLDASRWFFEVLVLKSKNYVELEQAEPYADIAIAPKPLLATS